MKKEICQEIFNQGYDDYNNNQFICPYYDTDDRSQYWCDGWWNAKMNDRSLTHKESVKYMENID